MQTESFTLTTALGHRVDAIATTPDDAEAAYVFAHGAGAGMAHPFMAGVAQGLAERRIACLRYQFPYMQAGSRRVDAAPVAQATVRAAVAWAQGRWPGATLLAGGKSFGGRMGAQAQAAEALPGVEGLVFLGFPLDPAGRPGTERAAHLAQVELPMLFVRGTRDALAEAGPYAELVAQLGGLATHLAIAEADHGFHVLRRSGRSDEEAMEELLDGLWAWTQAWRLPG